MEKVKKALADPLRALLLPLEKTKLIHIYNALIDLRKGPRAHCLATPREFEEIIQYSEKRSGISDHLPLFFIESLSVRPKLIVELGVRTGHSTFALERVAKLCDSFLVSVDVDDCSHASSYEHWIFVQNDDIAFAGEFKNWCERRGLRPEIDILFIDTSHTFSHTVQEIDSWFPLLSCRAKVFFHDTNLSNITVRRDGSIGLGWNNRRGVIRALEEYFKKRFNEKEVFVDVCDGWLIKHWSNCNGFTILERVDWLASAVSTGVTQV